MKVRAAELSDADQMATLAASADTAAHWNEHAYSGIFSGSDRVAYVAVSNARVIGFIVAHTVTGECEIENIVVAASQRRQGIGVALVRAVLGLAEAKSATKLLLEVRESNHAARGLYRKLGFNESGLRPGYYSKPDEDAVILTLHLH
jgi:[ribosomal protein S18]-alanine N-acetyltransferase